MPVSIAPTLTNISQCYSQIRAIDAEIDDAKKSLTAIANEEVGSLIPKGTLSVLDALREVEAKFLEDSPKEKARKRQARIDGVKGAIAQLENERDSVLATKEGMEEQCRAILSKIAKVGEKAMKAQKQFYEAIAELEALKAESNEYQRLQDSRSNPPIEFRLGSEGILLTRIEYRGFDIFRCNSASTFAGLEKIYQAVGVKKQ